MNDKSAALSQLAPSIWEATSILRSPMDVADFETYLFPPLFFRPTSDAQDDKHRTALGELGRDYTRIILPESYLFWSAATSHGRRAVMEAVSASRASSTFAEVAPSLSAIEPTECSRDRDQ